MDVWQWRLGAGQVALHGSPRATSRTLGGGLLCPQLIAVEQTEDAKVDKALGDRFLPHALSLFTESIA